MPRRTREPVREPDLNLPELRPADRAQLESDSEHDGLNFSGLDLDRHVAGNQRFVECRLTGRLGEVQLRRSRFNTCLLDELSVTSLDVAESEWSDVVVQGGRIGALLAPGATLSRVALRHLRADYVNLRGTDVTDLQIRDCRILELDFGGARLRRGDFAGSEIERLTLSEATLDELDLRQADISVVEDIAQLRGALINERQLTRLAPALASHLGICVEDAVESAAEEF